MNIIVLPDRFRLDARSNLDRLVERARRSKVFAGTVNFDDPVWDLSAVKVARPSARSAGTYRLYFATHAEGIIRGVERRTLMSERFASLFKAMIVLREEGKPVSTITHGRMLDAARSLCAAMGEGGDPADLVSADFAAACSDIRTRKTQRGKQVTAGSARSLGNVLCLIAEFVNRHSLSKVHISFANPFPVIANESQSLDEEAQKERAKKMATKEEIGAIVDASLVVRERGEDRDVLRMSVVELMCCAPVRINEVLDTRFDCRRTDRTRREATGEEVEYLGYAYNGSKEAPDSTKWFPSVMADIADRALADALRITEPYREIARWMERHPGRAYVAQPWRLADSDILLSGGELSRALGLNAYAIYQWMKENGVGKHVQGKLRCYRLGDIEAAILRQQPKLPDPKTKLSDYMFIVPKHYFHAQRGTQNYVLTIIGDAQISHFLGGHTVYKGVFERLDILDEKNKPYRINTHSIRHYLNTLAQQGMLSQLDIARWSGRKGVGQNAVYDHTGGIQLSRALREVIDAGKMEGPVAETVEHLPPAERDDFLKGRFSTAHFTSIGACIQDFSMAPCPSHGSCAGCSEHLVVKGKAGHQEEAERLLQEHQAELEFARSEMTDGVFNASVWVGHHEKVVAGLQKTVAVHQNRDIPDGTIVQV